MKGNLDLAEYLKKIEFQKRELQIRLGKENYKLLINDIKSILVAHDLDEFTTHHLFTHLNDISRVERIRV